MVFRIVFAATLLLCVVILDTQALLFSLVFLAVTLLFARGEKVILIARSLRLLVWLYLPIIFFHGLFTPGTYTYYALALPVSLEGLEQGSFLCLKMTAMFFSALLISRLLTASEWLYYLRKVPRLADSLIPYLLLLPQLRQQVSIQLQLQKQKWVNQGQLWSEVPARLVQSVEVVLLVGKQEAGLLWENWDKRILDFKQQAVTTPLVSVLDLGYGVLTLMAWYLLWIK